MLAKVRKGAFDWANGAARSVGPKRWGKKAAAQVAANVAVTTGIINGLFGGQTLGNVFYNSTTGTATSGTTTTTFTTNATSTNYAYILNQQQAQMAQYAAQQQAAQAFGGGGGGGLGPNVVVASGGALGITSGVTGGRIRVNPGDMITVDLPDGAVLTALADGSYKIEDKDAKITYKAARVREFNQYLNASDLLEQFVAYAKQFGVRQSEFMNLPIELFINWLVLRAAEADGEPAPVDVPDPAKRLPLLLPAPTYGSRCLDCGRFIPEKPKLLGILFCNGGHMERYRTKLALRAA